MKKILSMMLVIAMIVSVFAGIAIPAAAAESFTKATSIAVGDKVVFVSEAASAEMTNITTKYGEGTTYTDAISGTYVLEVVAGANEGTYAFKNADGYMNWTSGNSVTLAAELSANTSWTVSFDEDGNATIANAANPDRVIWWNVQNPRFATYEGKTANDAYFNVQLYKLTSGGNTELPEIPEDPTETEAPTETEPTETEPTETEPVVTDAPVINGNFGKATAIAVGDRVVLVCEGSSNELSSFTTYGVPTAYTDAVAGILVMEVVAGVKEGTYAFKTGDNYMNWTANNTLNLAAEINENSSWTVEIDDAGNATITNVANTARVIWWNNQNPRFSTYEGKSATDNYLNVQLYKELAEGECAHTNATSEVTTAAGCETTGIMTWTCECGKTWTTVIAATGHNYVDNVCQNCGDELQTEEPEVPVEPEAPADGLYVIAAKVEDTYYAMANTFASKIPGTAITVTDGKVAAADAGNYFITLTAEEGGWTISNGETYLKYNSSTNLASTTEKYAWTLEAGNHGTWRFAAQTSGRALLFRAKTYMLFGGYSSSNATANSTEYYDLELLPVDGTPVVPDPTEPTTETDPTEPSETEPTESEPVVTEPEIPAEIANGQYVIAAKVEDVYYAMANTFAAKIPGTAVTVTDGAVAAADAASYVVTITNVDGGITISCGDNFLKYNSSTSLASSTEAYTWTLFNGENGSFRVNAQAEDRALVFRAGTAFQFGGYSTKNLEGGSTEYFDVEFLPISGTIEEPTEPTEPTESEPTEPSETDPTVPSESEPDASVEFEGYEKATALAIGDKVVMICEGTAMELTELTTSKSGFGTGTAYTDALSGALVFEIVAGAEAGTYAFKTAEGYLSWISGNSLMLAEALDANASWNVSFDADGNAIIANSTNALRVIWYSASYDRFNTYEDKTAGNNYTNVQLYLKTTAEEEVPSIVDLKINHTLNLASDISINFAVSAGLLADYDSFYLECLVPVYEGNTATGTKTVIVEPVLNVSYYYFTLTGVTAVQMNDIIEATLHLTKGSEKFVTNVDVYSVGTYAYSQLNKTNASAKLKALCADLLRYGSYAQIFKGYRNDALVDAAMTAEMKALLSDIDAVTFNNVKEEIAQIENPTVTVAGRSLTLDSKVTLNYVLDLSKFTGNKENLTVHVTYTDLYNQTKTVVLSDMIVYNEARHQYSFAFDALLAAELRTVLTAVVYDGETQVSNAFTYTIDTYGNGKSGALLDLCKALMAYSDTALAYFVG